MEGNGSRKLNGEIKPGSQESLVGSGLEDQCLPRRTAVSVICRRYLDLLLSAWIQRTRLDAASLDRESRRNLEEVEALLSEQIGRGMCFAARQCAMPLPASLVDRAAEQIKALFAELPELSRLLALDIVAAFENDPAAPSQEEILLSYPALEAISVQRLAHRLYRMGAPFVPRMMTEVAHSHTGIDIHPGAAIGESFFIDHGTGVVIGETATIGKRVTLYHGVTLGAFNPLLRDKTGQLIRGQANKRHPDLEDHVTVYPNATILGGETRIGHHSVIGGNVWLTYSVEPYSKVTVEDPKLVILNGVAKGEV